MTWMIGLLVAGVVLILAEMFIPGGVAGTVGLVCLMIGVGLAFGESLWWGVGSLIGSVVFAGVCLWIWLNYLPKTAVGKQIFLGSSGKDWHGYDETQSELVGKKGVAKSMLRPTGTALIDGQRLDVVTEGALLDEGTAIEVIQVEGNRVVVAAVPEETGADDPANAPPTESNPSAG